MTEFFALAATILFGVRLALFVALHLMSSPYNVIEHAVSDYAVGPTRRVSTAMTWITCLAWAALAATIAGLGWPDRTSTVIQLAVLAAIFVVLPFLPTDVEGKRVTVVGAAHYVVAIAWFALTYSVSGNVTRNLTRGAGTDLGGALSVLHWVMLISLIALVVALVLKPLRRYAFGISERVFLLAVNVFFLLAAIACLSQ